MQYLRHRHQWSFSHGVNSRRSCWGTCGLEAFSSAAKNKCVTLKTSKKESPTLEIAKAIPSIAAFPELYFISPLAFSLCSLRCLKQKAFQKLSLKKMPHLRVCGKRLHSYPSGYLSKVPLLSFTVSLLAGSDFIKVHS